ncbi:MAG: cytochrome P450 [Myxococcota bacterium]
MAIPKAPARLVLGQITGRGARRYEMRGLHTRLHRELGPVVGMGGGRFYNVTLFGPDANRFVLLDRERLFSAREPWTLIMGGIFPNGLLLRDGDEHRHHRKIMHETFKRPVLREYTERMGPAIAAGLDRFAPRPGGGRLRAFDAYKALTLDMAASIFVGVDLGPAARRMNGAFEAMVAASMPGLRLPFAGRYKRGLDGRRTLLSLLGDMIPKKRGDPAGDLFSRLCRARSETGEVFSDQEILDHMIFLMMAAHDTTTSTLTSLTWELARHPEWQERIREESLALGDPCPGFDDLDRLPALTWAMQEVLRLYPPLPVIPRTATRDFEWQGHTIRQGTMVVVSPIHTHVMPEWWSEPERFQPERFAPERAEHERHTHSWIPFGGGTHMCLGRRFAEAQVRLVAHQLVQRFRWSVPDGYVMPVQQAPISKPVDGLPIEVESLS